MTGNRCARATRQSAAGAALVALMIEAAVPTQVNGGTVSADRLMWAQYLLTGCPVCYSCPSKSPNTRHRPTSAGHANRRTMLTCAHYMTTLPPPAPPNTCTPLPKPSQQVPEQLTSVAMHRPIYMHAPAWLPVLSLSFRPCTSLAADTVRLATATVHECRCHRHSGCSCQLAPSASTRAASAAALPLPRLLCQLPPAFT